MKKYFLPIFLLPFLGCATFPPSNGGDPIELEYRYSYDEVWGATLLALKKFPLKTMDKDSGKIETEWLDRQLLPKYALEDKLEQFKLEIYVLRGWKVETRSTRGSTEPVLPVDPHKGPITVRVLKTDRYRILPLAEWQEKESNAVLEKTLLFRIRRLIQLERRITAYQPAL